MADATILIVEDEPDMAENCVRVLAPEGYTCRAAQTLEDAVAILGADVERPDLVITDLRLPRREGLAVTRQARETSPAIPVILMTAYDSSAAEADAYAAGASVYLAKPFANARLLEAVQRLVGVPARAVASKP
jgi:two-component system, NtrC family, response regulator GlrR